MHFAVNCNKAKLSWQRVVKNNILSSNALIPHASVINYFIDSLNYIAVEKLLSLLVVRVILCRNIRG